MSDGVAGSVRVLRGVVFGAGAALAMAVLAASHRAVASELGNSFGQIYAAWPFTFVVAAIAAALTPMPFHRRTAAACAIRNAAWGLLVGSAMQVGILFVHVNSPVAHPLHGYLGWILAAAAVALLPWERLGADGASAVVPNEPTDAPRRLP